MGRPKGVSPYSMLNPGDTTCSIERVRHCLVPIVRDKSRPFLSLVVAVVVLEVIDAPIGECLGVLFLHPQRCSCSISVFVTIVGVLTTIRYRIARKCIFQQRSTFPTQAPDHEFFPPGLGFHLGIWLCLLGEYRSRFCRWTNSHLG